MNSSKRKFLGQILIVGSAAVFPPLRVAMAVSEAEITPSEILARGHGIIDRALLLFQVAALRLEKNEALPTGGLRSLIQLSQKFFHQYHEPLEELYVFPVLDGDAELRPLIKTLQVQHNDGRRISSLLEDAYHLPAEKTKVQNLESAASIRAFVRMYEAHAAFEDTAVFPALEHRLTAVAYRSLSKKFAKKESEVFGHHHAFSSTLKELSSLEIAFGSADLASYSISPNPEKA